MELSVQGDRHSQSWPRRQSKGNTERYSRGLKVVERPLKGPSFLQNISHQMGVKKQLKAKKTATLKDERE